MNLAEGESCAAKPFRARAAARLSASQRRVLPPARCYHFTSLSRVIAK